MSKPEPENVTSKIAEYYSGKLLQYGATPRGVDWNSEEAQRVRFDQITKICPAECAYALLDYGCGYGALVEYLRTRHAPAQYAGYDVSATMIRTAQSLHAGCASCRFTSEASSLTPADCTVASGIFSVRMDVATEEWER